MKEQRKIERAEKKKVQEEKKKELAKKREEKRKEREEKKKQQQQKKRKRATTVRIESEEESHHSNSEDEMDHQGTSNEQPATKKSHTRSLRIPSRYQDVESSDDSDTVCSKCNKREPEWSEGNDHIFWIDCDSCGKWYHTLCVHGKNGSTQRLLCEDCLP